MHDEFHSPRDTLDHAQYLVRHVEPGIVTFVLVGEAHRIDHPHLTVSRVESGLEHERPRQIPARLLERVDGTEIPVTAVRIEETREHRAGIESRQAQPVDRTGSIH